MLQDVDLQALNLVLIQVEEYISAYVAYRMKKLVVPNKLIEEIDSAPEPPPRCPSGHCKIHMRIKQNVQEKIANSLGTNVKVGTSPAMKHIAGSGFVPLVDKKKATPAIEEKSLPAPQLTSSPYTPGTTQFVSIVTTGANNVQNFGIANMRKKNFTQILQTSSGTKHILLPMINQQNPHLVLNKNQNTYKQIMHVPLMIQSQIPTGANVGGQSGVVATTAPSQIFANALIQHVKQQNSSQIQTVTKIIEEIDPNEEKPEDSEFYLYEKEQLKKESRQNMLKLMSTSNVRKCQANPVYGSDLRDCCSCITLNSKSLHKNPFIVRSYTHCREIQKNDWSLGQMIKSIEQRTEEFLPLFSKFVLFVPPVSSKQPELVVSHMNPSRRCEENQREQTICTELARKTEFLHPIASAMCTQVSFSIYYSLWQQSIYLGKLISIWTFASSLD